MYAGIVTIPLQKGKAEEFDRVTQQQARGVGERSKGFRGGDMLIDDQHDAGCPLTVWDSREDAECLTTSEERQSIVSALSDAVAGEPRVEIYEVVLLAARASRAPNSRTLRSARPRHTPSRGVT